jgi:L-iditol 2-dehydrogenase
MIFGVQYLAMREDMVFRIPDHLTYEEAALNEPFSVGIHAARRTPPNGMP